MWIFVVLIFLLLLSSITPAVAQVSTVTLSTFGIGDNITISGIGGTAAAVNAVTDISTTVGLLVAEINGRTGETVVATNVGGVLTLTANTAGTAGAFTAAAAVVDAGTATVTTATVRNTATVGANQITTGNYYEASAAVSDLATLLADADTQLAGTVKYYVGQVGSNSYIVADDDFSGITDVIKLTGVTLSTIAAGDFDPS